MSQPDLASLTPREREILILVAEGHSLAEIAQRLHRSLKTIESHRLSVGRKLKASNRVELAKIAIAHGLVQVQDGPVDIAGAGEPPLAAQELEWIEMINQATGRLIGQAYLKHFCEAASQLPGIDLAAICMPDLDTQGEVQLYQRCVVAVSENGICGEPTGYQAKGTPCEKIIEEGQYRTNKQVADAFPEDAWLGSLKAQGYLGQQLVSSSGTAVGGLAFISRSPLEETASYDRVIDFYAPRLANELEQYVKRRQLDRQREALEDEITKYRQEIESLTGAKPKISQVSKLTDRLAGPSYLRAMTNAMSEVFGVQFVGICTLTEGREPSNSLYTISISEGGQQADTSCYQLEKTPCETVVCDGSLVIRDGILAAYPEDRWLADFGVQSYVGTRLENQSGEPLGIMWVIDTDPISKAKADHIVDAMDHFVPRISAEIQNYLEMEDLRLTHENALKRMQALTSEIQAIKAGTA